MIILICALGAKAQTSTSVNYDDQDLIYKTVKGKPQYVETTTNNLDGTTTITVVGVKKNKTLRHEFYRGDEPIGKWTLIKGYENYPTTLDYDFILAYKVKQQKRPDSADFISAKTVAFPLIDNDSLGYKAPKFSTGEKTFAQFVQKHIAYPFQAIKQEISGSVSIGFIVGVDGKIEDIGIVKGVHPLLDKEAMRIVNLIKFANPPSIHAVNRKLSLVLPIGFRLE